MPTVPTYDERKVKIAPMPGVRQNINTTADDFGGLQARSMRQAGADIGQAADRMSAYAEQRQKEDNEAAVWDTYIRLSDQERDYLYNAETGAYNRQGSDALGLSKNSAKDIGGMAEKLSGTLQNDEQRQMFQKLYQRKLDGTLDGLARHEAAERQKWKNQVAEGVLKTSQQNAAATWNNPANTDREAEIGATAIAGNLASKGTPKELIDAEVATHKSSVWKAALTTAMQHDPIQAKKLLDENRSKLTGEDAAAIDKVLETPLRAARASAAAAQVVTPTGGLPLDVSSKIAQRAAAEGVDVNTALAIAKLENPSGKVDARPLRRDGTPMSSAVGHFQIINATWRELGGTDEDRLNADRQIELGIKNIKKNTEALRTSLGREPTSAEIYLAHQQGLGGAKALLSAAPNETALSALTRAHNGDAVRATKAVVDNGGSATMLASDFVEKWQGKYAIRAGVGRKPVDMPLDDKIAAARALAGDDIEQQKANVAEVVAQHNTMKAAARDQQDAAWERIYEHVARTGTYVGAPADALAQLSFKDVVEFQGKARDVKTDWSYYDQFMAMTPAEKTAVPLPELMTKLGPTELRAAIKDRSDGKGGASKSPWLQERATIMRTFAIEAGIPVQKGNKPLSEKDQAVYNAYSSYMNQRRDAYREKHGQEMPEAEFRNEAARAVTRVVTQENFGLRGLIAGDDKARVFELNGKPITTIKSTKDVPPTVRSDIEGAIRAAGKNVSDSVVLALAKAWLVGDREGARAIMAAAR